MKSSTVKFNIYQLLGTIILAAAAYSVFPNIPQGLFISLSIIGMVCSQAITFFTPSGEFVGHGQNWLAGKWIARVGSALLGIFALMTQHNWAVVAISLMTPILEIIIRMYGSDTPDQQMALRNRK